MTSPKSVKIGNRLNFSTNYRLEVVDPSFFMFFDALFEGIHLDGVGGKKCADVSIFDLPDD